MEEEQSSKACPVEGSDVDKSFDNSKSRWILLYLNVTGATPYQNQIWTSDFIAYYVTESYLYSLLLTWPSQW